jgi:GntR family transcriptional regulator
VINRNSPDPPYLQVAGFLREEIRSGQLKTGDRVPSLRTLARTYQITVTTAAKAIAVLADENLVTQRQGWGTFVR